METNLSEKQVMGTRDLYQKTHTCKCQILNQPEFNTENQEKKMDASNTMFCRKCKKITLPILKSSLVWLVFNIQFILCSWKLIKLTYFFLGAHIWAWIVILSKKNPYKQPPWLKHLPTRCTPQQKVRHCSVPFLHKGRGLLTHWKL